MENQTLRDMYNTLMYGNLDVQTNKNIVERMIFEVTKMQSSDIVDGEPIDERKFYSDDMSLAEGEYIKKLGCLLQTSLIDKKEIADMKRDIYKGLVKNGGGKKYDSLLSTWLLSFACLEKRGNISGYNAELLQEVLIKEGRSEFVKTYFDCLNENFKNITTGTSSGHTPN